MQCVLQMVLFTADDFSGMGQWAGGNMGSYLHTEGSAQVEGRDVSAIVFNGGGGHHICRVFKNSMCFLWAIPGL